MSSAEHEPLVAFMGRQFSGIDRRFDGVDRQLTDLRHESLEALRRIGQRLAQ
jgi:hypothetical protein